MLGQKLLRPFTMLVVGLAVVTAATSATAVVVAVRRDDPKVPPAALNAGSSTTVPTLTADDSVVPETTTAAVPSEPPISSVEPTSTSGSTAAPPGQCAQLHGLPTRAKLAQLLFVGVSDAGSARIVLGGSTPAGGVLVMGKGSTWFGNGVLKGIAAGARIPPVVTADEEGGRVQRIDAIAGTMPSAYAMGRLTPPEIRAIAKRRGLALRNLGFTMDLAPVVDLYDKNNAVINDRAFDADPDKVIVDAQAFAGGLQDAGVRPVLKHFPGHGHSTGDSHVQSVQTPPLSELRKADLKPFQALARSMPAVMVGHLDVPGFTDPGRPTSVSPQTINGLLRKELGFQGLVITDDLSGMKAITDRFTLPDAIVASISAGADVAIVAFGAGQSLDPLLNLLEKAVQAGKLPMARVDEALDHLAAVKPSCR